ncbi:MAG: RNA-binding S4 domain-containing protein [Planctomycetota bacterium]
MSTPDDGPEVGPGAGGPRPRRRREGFTLDRFMKYECLVDTGGMAKQAIQGGLVRVNGELETRRRRQLQPGDRIEFEGETRIVPAPAS